MRVRTSHSLVNGVLISSRIISMSVSGLRFNPLWYSVCVRLFLSSFLAAGEKQHHVTFIQWPWQKLHINILERIIWVEFAYKEKKNCVDAPFTRHVLEYEMIVYVLDFFKMSWKVTDFFTMDTKSNRKIFAYFFEAELEFFCQLYLSNCNL